LLYNSGFFVSRLDYPQEEAELAASGRIFFNNWKRETHRKGDSKWKSAEFAEGYGECLTKAGSAAIKYFSTARLYDSIIDFDCLYKKLPPETEPSMLRWFLRETEHSNALIIHGAQELFLSTFLQQRRHSYEVLSSRAFQFKPQSETLNISYSQVSVRRSWLDETYWNFAKSGASHLLRNEYFFNSGGDQLRTGELCFIREISLICRTGGGDRVCRIDNAHCERISRDIAK
jgi:hypothetical protein